MRPRDFDEYEYYKAESEKRSETRKSDTKDCLILRVLSSFFQIHKPFGYNGLHCLLSKHCVFLLLWASKRIIICL